VLVEAILFGKRLRQLREERELTQEELAFMTGVKDSKTVSNWERGIHGPKFHHLAKIAEVLDVSMQSLLDFSKISKEP
jgi:transcriptional regulator with XRE-family HTH domain